MILDPIDYKLMDLWQRNFPITLRPYHRVGQSLSLSEADVIRRITALLDRKIITRVGATCAPNTVSASTLAAIAAPKTQIEEIARIVNDEPGVNHSYERENEWNLWFVITGPDRNDVNQARARIERRTGLKVLNLPLIRPFKLDLGFKFLSDTPTQMSQQVFDKTLIQRGDKDILAALTNGIAPITRPYQALAQTLNQSEAHVLERIKLLQQAGFISRLGLIVRHRALGWRANAMVVWDISSEHITEAGPELAKQKGITLCYERRHVPGVWPYRLYTMIHAKTRDEALEHLARAAALPIMKNVPYQVLFSTQCFRQTGAMIARKEERVI